jgi:hypothetical protein
MNKFQAKNVFFKKKYIFGGTKVLFFTYYSSNR